MTKRIVDYAQNIIVNGLVLSSLYFLFVWLFMPTSFYFDYDKVVYQGRDAAELGFISYINYNKSSDSFVWNDSLRCDNGKGYFAYVSSYDTMSATTKIEPKPYQTEWMYRSPIKIGRRCQMNSTVTKYVHGFIPKKELIQSEVFIID